MSSSSLAANRSLRQSFVGHALQPNVDPPQSLLRRALNVAARILAILAVAFAVQIVASYFELSQAPTQLLSQYPLPPPPPPKLPPPAPVPPLPPTPKGPPAILNISYQDPIANVDAMQALIANLKGQVTDLTIRLHPAVNTITVYAVQARLALAQANLLANEKINSRETVHSPKHCS